MADDVSTAAATQQETPSSDAAQSAANYITGALAAAQIYVARNTARAGAAQDRDDSIEAARQIYGPFLARDRGRNASSSVALSAWQAALPFRDRYTDANKAAGRAEDRLRVLHPDAMARFDALRAGLDPVPAMREVAPLISSEIANPQARAEFAPMLGDTQGREATSSQALTAWQAALPLREHIPDADLAASRAEDRLRVLHPEAMARYDALRAEHSPADAARQAAVLVDAPAQIGVTAASDPVSNPASNAAGSASHPTDGEGGQVPAAVVAPQKRYADAVNAALPGELAALVLADKAWPRLAEALDHAEKAGADPADLLATVAGQREMNSAASPALVLAHRVNHTEHTAPQAPEQAPETEQSAGQLDTTTATAEQIPASPAAAIAAQTFPTPITDAPAPGTAADAPAAAAAVTVLHREGEVLSDSSREAASTRDDPRTPVDEQRAGGAHLSSRPHDRLPTTHAARSCSRRPPAPRLRL